MTDFQSSAPIDIRQSTEHYGNSRKQLLETEQPRGLVVRTSDY
jgi:hypothetical protein